MPIRSAAGWTAPRPCRRQRAAPPAPASRTGAAGDDASTRSRPDTRVQPARFSLPRRRRARRRATSNTARDPGSGSFQRRKNQVTRFKKNEGASPLTTHHSPLTTHHSPLTTHHKPQNKKKTKTNTNTATKNTKKHTYNPKTTHR